MLLFYKTKINSKNGRRFSITCFSTHKQPFRFYHHDHIHVLELRIFTDINVIFLVGQIPDVNYLTWLLCKLKFSHNFTCVSQGLTTVVPENTKRMHACITLFILSLEIDGLVKRIANCGAMDDGEVLVWK